MEDHLVVLHFVVKLVICTIYYTQKTKVKKKAPKSFLREIGAKVYLSFETRNTFTATTQSNVNSVTHKISKKEKKNFKRKKCKSIYV